MADEPRTKPLKACHGALLMSRLVTFLESRGMEIKLENRHEAYAYKGYGSIHKKPNYTLKRQGGSLNYGTYSHYVVHTKDRNSSVVGMRKQIWGKKLKIAVYKYGNQYGELLDYDPISDFGKLEHKLYTVCSVAIRRKVNAWELTPKDLYLMLFPRDVMHCFPFVDLSRGSARFRKRWKAYDAWLRSSKPRLFGWDDYVNPH